MQPAGVGKSRHKPKDDADAGLAQQAAGVSYLCSVSSTVGLTRGHGLISTLYIDS
jgi:hypothetical protein